MGTAYGGDSLIIDHAEALKFSLKEGEAHDIATPEVRLINAANAQLGFEHRESADWRHISCSVARPLAEAASEQLSRRYPAG